MVNIMTIETITKSLHPGVKKHAKSAQTILVSVLTFDPPKTGN